MEIDKFLERTYVGSLCKREHDNGNGLSLRYKSDRTCILCHQESKRNRSFKTCKEEKLSTQKIPTNRKIALEQSHSTYLGRLCKRGHDAGGGCSERYTFTRACLLCNRNAGEHKKSQKRRADAPILSPKAPKEVKPKNQSKPRELRKPKKKKKYSQPVAVPVFSPTINQEKIDAEYRQRMEDMKRLDYQMKRKEKKL